jgi:hypothetical protein
MSQLKHRVDRLYRRTHGFIPACDLRFLIRFFEYLYAKHPKAPDFEDMLERYRSLNDQAEESPELEETIAYGRRNMAFMAQIFLDVTRKDLERYPKGFWAPKSMYASHRSHMRQAVAFFRRTGGNSRF